MDVTISPEFEAFARQQVQTGAFASEQEAVEAALKGYVDDFYELRASLQQAASELDRGEGLDGETFMAELLAHTEARAKRIE